MRLSTTASLALCMLCCATSWAAHDVVELGASNGAVEAVGAVSVESVNEVNVMSVNELLQHSPGLACLWR